MLRHGSLVEITESAKDHPIFGNHVGKRYKVDEVQANGKFVRIRGDLFLPVRILKQIPQKKGKKVAA